MRRLGFAAAAAVVAAAVTVGEVCSCSPPNFGPPPPPPPPADTANLWVRTTPGGPCTYSTTPVVYDEANACGDSASGAGDALERAYGHASLQCTDTIRVQTGNYAYQTIDYQPSRAACGSQIAVRAEANVVAPGLYLAGAGHLNLVGFQLLNGTALKLGPDTGSKVKATSHYADDVTVDGFTMEAFLLRNVRNVTIKNSTIGGYDESVQAYGPPKVGGYAPDGTTTTTERWSMNVVIQDNDFLDIIRTVVGSSHSECLYLDSRIDGIVIERNLFSNCAVFDIFAQVTNGQNNDNVTIRNNFLDIPRDTLGAASPTAINFKGDTNGAHYANLKIEWNNLVGNMLLKDEAYAGLSIKANASVNTGCTTSALNPNVSSSWYTSNIFSVACVPAGGSDTTADPLFVSSSTAACSGWPSSPCFRNDPHLQAGSPAVGTSPAGYPTVDFDGQTRPQGAGADKGADDR